VRGRYGIGDGRWAIPFYVDAGTGSSDLTWQASTDLAYRYNWGELIIVFRHLEYDEGSDKFLQNLAFSGPTVGARIRF
jgi:hypothetical protein